MKTIPLTQDQVALVDDSDFESANRWSWCAVLRDGAWYAQSRIAGELHYLHRWLFNEPENQIDHKDGDGLNNRRENLRVCTNSQNGANRGKSKSRAYSSRYEGVCWDSYSGSWKISIGIDGKQIHLGRSPRQTLAALIYDKTARDAFGEFAKPNFPRCGRDGRSTICFVGWGRAGKDEAGAFCHEHLGLKYAGSTSWQAIPFMSEFLGRHPMHVWEQRHQHRQMWKDYLDELRRGDETLLIEMALAGGEVIAGIRGKDEVDAARAKDLFSHVVWVERPGIPRDPTVTFGPEDATDYIRNDGSLRRFHKNIVVWAHSVCLPVRLSDYATELLADLDPD